MGDGGDADLKLLLRCAGGKGMQMENSCSGVGEEDAGLEHPLGCLVTRMPSENPAPTGWGLGAMPASGTGGGHNDPGHPSVEHSACQSQTHALVWGGEGGLPS